MLLPLLEDLSFCYKTWQKSIKGQPESSHTSTFHFCSIHFSILQSGPISPEWSPSLRFFKVDASFSCFHLMFYKVFLGFYIFLFCQNIPPFYFTFSNIFFSLNFFSVSETRVKKNHGRRRSKSVEHNYGAIEGMSQKITQYSISCVMTL